MTSRYGITIPFDGVTLLEHREWFHKLVDLGYTDVWSSEVDGVDGFTPLTLAAVWEPSLNLGVAVTPVFTRGAGLLAMSIAALAEIAGDRFTMGLGASSEPVVQRWNGVKYEKPYARTRDTLRFVQRALAGEKIDEVFETFEVHGFKLSRPVAARPPILLGALRPGMLRLAGREADGAILNWLAASDVAQCRARPSRRGSSLFRPTTPTPRALSVGE
jgi:probable F420-dependent oxidoreductase